MKKKTRLPIESSRASILLSLSKFIGRNNILCVFGGLISLIIYLLTILLIFLLVFIRLLLFFSLQALSSPCIYPLLSLERNVYRW